MRNSKKQLLGIVAFFVVLSAGWVSCTKTGSSYTTSPVTYVTIMNMAAYGPTTDIYLNDTLATGTNGIAPGVFSTLYGSLKPGNYAVKFTKNGSKDSVLASLPSSRFDTLNFYTLILYNDTNRVAHAMNLHDNFTSISPTSTNFRFFNLSPDAPSVDFYLNSAKIMGGRTTGDNADPNSSFNNFQSIAAQSFTIQVKKANDTTVLATLSNQNLVGGNVYTIFLSGAKSSSTNPLKLNVLPASY